MHPLPSFATLTRTHRPTTRQPTATFTFTFTRRYVSSIPLRHLESSHLAQTSSTTRIMAPYASAGHARFMARDFQDDTGSPAESSVMQLAVYPAIPYPLPSKSRDQPQEHRGSTTLAVSSGHPLSTGLRRPIVTSSSSGSVVFTPQTSNPPSESSAGLLATAPCFRPRAPTGPPHPRAAFEAAPNIHYPSSTTHPVVPRADCVADGYCTNVYGEQQPYDKNTNRPTVPTGRSTTLVLRLYIQQAGHTDVRLSRGEINARWNANVSYRGGVVLQSNLDYDRQQRDQERFRGG